MAEVILNTDLSRAARVLDNFSAYEKGAQCSALTLLPLSAGLNKLEAAEAREALASAGRVLRTSRTCGVSRYDIFAIAHFLPNEDSLSDAIASLLNPNELHALGVAPLRCLLQNISITFPAHGPCIRAILPYLTDPSSIRVEKRIRREETVPDLEIHGRGFIIFIENKLSGGCETVFDGKSQTHRQWRQLQKLARVAGVPQERTLALFLSPQGKSAACGHFIPISVGLLVASIRQALDIVDADKDPLLHTSIEAFLQFYNGY